MTRPLQQLAEEAARPFFGEWDGWLDSPDGDGWWSEARTLVVQWVRDTYGIEPEVSE